jgi:hypothetical protein
MIKLKYKVKILLIDHVGLVSPTLSDGHCLRVSKITSLYNKVDLLTLSHVETLKVTELLYIYQ